MVTVPPTRVGKAGHQVTLVSSKHLPSHVCDLILFGNAPSGWALYDSLAADRRPAHLKSRDLIDYCTWVLGFGLQCCHTATTAATPLLLAASPPITSGTHTICAWISIMLLIHSCSFVALFFWIDSLFLYFLYIHSLVVVLLHRCSCYLYYWAGRPRLLSVISAQYTLAPWTDAAVLDIRKIHLLNSNSTMITKVISVVYHITTTISNDSKRPQSSWSAVTISGTIPGLVDNRSRCHCQFRQRLNFTLSAYQRLPERFFHTIVLHSTCLRPFLFFFVSGFSPAKMKKSKRERYRMTAWIITIFTIST